MVKSRQPERCQGIGPGVTVRRAYNAEERERLDGVLPSRFSLFPPSCSLAALVEENSVQRGGDAGFGGQLRAPIFWDRVDTEMGA